VKKFLQTEEKQFDKEKGDETNIHKRHKPEMTHMPLLLLHTLKWQGSYCRVDAQFVAIVFWSEGNR
jgi:hypothetical protein